MRKQIQKLRLHRETLCALEHGQLEVIQGAALTALANCSEIITSCNG
jgi:hypothetical protein